jgi:hypothetical protein
MKERILRLCARGKIAINLRGLEYLQTHPGEDEDSAWKRLRPKVHEGSGAGQGLDTLTRDAADQLSGDDFWSFVERLATGRRLVITSDHGYAATGYFPDADGEVGEVGQFLKKTFASGRSAKGTGDIGPFVPPVALQINSPHGALVRQLVDDRLLVDRLSRLALDQFLQFAHSLAKPLRIK